MFKQNLNEIEDEITALSTIKSLLQSFIERLNIKSSALRLLDDEVLLEIVDSLTAFKNNLKEYKTMEELNKATERMNKIRDRDVRIIYLPPATVIASDYIHIDADNAARKALDQFVSDHKLTEIKPDIRYYDFIRPNPNNTGEYGYEIWITIPDNIEVPINYTKKKFDGGLYAAYTIQPSEWNMWGQLVTWFKDNMKYEWNGVNDGSFMHGLIDEHLNYINHVNIPDEQISDLQFDLMVPVKERKAVK